MIVPELKEITSPDLEPPDLPDDPSDCQVSFCAVVGPKGGPAEASFAFSVVTPAYLRRLRGAVWGRGFLIVPAFEWATVVEAVAQLLARCARPSWTEVAAELDRELRWEVETDEPADA